VGGWLVGWARVARPLYQADILRRRSPRSSNCDKAGIPALSPMARWCHYGSPGTAGRRHG